MNKYTVYAQCADDKQAGNLFARMMRLWHGLNVTWGISDAADVTLCRDASLPDEGFRITADGGKITIFGNGRRGVSYGAAQLAKQYDGSSFHSDGKTESPAYPFRGIHLYMPGKKDLAGFYRIIDAMVIMRHNTMILEVGGGMEYKRHPEINAGWERFCKQIGDFPGRSNGLQGNDSYWKDSTHTEIGGGTFIPQHAVRGIVNYAKDYGLDVVPELQMCSHAYYITTVYPELAEREADHYPDTVCPLNEDAYRLYFELADEVIDVFGPTAVSVGHDEIRVLGHCDKCKEKTGHELLAYEINRLHAFYKSRGITIAMWCEKLQNVKSYYTGKHFGGVEQDSVNELGRRWRLPATHDAITMIPKDILLLDWLYGWSWDSQETAEKHGFKQIFGNFHGEITRGFARRMSSPNVIGGETSSWCSANEYTIGHDGLWGDFWYSAMLLWDKEHDESQYDTYHARMKKELPRLREILQDRAAAAASFVPERASVIYTGGGAGERPIRSGDLPDIPLFNMLDLPETIGGSALAGKELYFGAGKTANRLVFVHTSYAEKKYGPSYRHEGDINDVDEWCPVVYAVRYADGETVFVKARYGMEIGNINMRTGREVSYAGATPEDSGGWGTTKEDCPDPPLYMLNAKWQNSLIYSAAPFYSGGVCAYIMEWINPKPDVVIEKIYAVNTAKSADEQALLYLVAAAD